MKSVCSYYELDSLDDANAINDYLASLIDRTVNDLAEAECVEVAQDDGITLIAQTYGRTAAYYYVKYKTAKQFGDALQTELEYGDLLTLLADANEFNELPVRHNEDLINAQMVQRTPLSIDALRNRPPDDSHLKTLLLFAAHFSRAKMPISDYGTDLKTVLDQSVRLLQCAIDLAAEHGLLGNTVRLIVISQMLVQACWPHDDPLAVQLPLLGESQLSSIAFCVCSLSGSDFDKRQRLCLPELLDAFARWPKQITAYLTDELQLPQQQLQRVCDTLSRFPLVSVQANLLAGQDHEVDWPAQCVNLLSEQAAQYIKVKRDSEYVLNVTLTRLSAASSSKVLAPRFPKAKNEMWYLLLGDLEKRELVALRRVHEISRPIGGSVKPVPLIFRSPEKPGRYHYSLYLLSDSYRGLDQQYELRLEVD